MTTLAQLIYELPPTMPTSLGRHAFTVFETVRLSIGFPGYHGDPKFLAERFCFDQPAKSLIEYFSELDTQTLMRSLNLPADPLWLEWPASDGLGRIGTLVGNVGDGQKMIIVGMMETGVPSAKACPYLMFTTDPVPTTKAEIELEHLWSVPGVVERGADSVTGQMYDLYSDVIMCLTALCIPRVTQIVKVQHPRKLQRARKKRGRVPLIEYQQVRMNIKTPTKRYHNPNLIGNSEASEAHRRRMHQVMGHFRTYQKGREQPRISWVPHHWRGDPNLGVLMHERHVKK